MSRLRVADAGVLLEQLHLGLEADDRREHLGEDVGAEGEAALWELCVDRRLDEATTEYGGVGERREEILEGVVFVWVDHEGTLPLTVDRSVSILVAIA